MKDVFCAECGNEIGPFYRDNEKGKGVEAIWKCERHVTRKPDPETKRIVDIIKRGARNELRF